MRLLLLVSIFLLYSSANSINDRLKKVRKNMIQSLDDINGTTKETISAIVNSSFNLKAYKENYLLPVSYRYNSDFIDNGTHDSKHVETEYQVSIKYDFSANLLGLGEIYSFGYTQRSWWQVYASSAFFRESNYQPEFFVKIPTYKFLKKSFVKGFKVSAIHESNGRGGEYERSWNKLSLSTFMQYKNLISEFEFWYRLPDNIDYNPDIEDYLGYGQLKLYIPYDENFIKVRLRANNNLHKGSLELTYTTPIPARDDNDLFFFIKTFNGYGESLIDYNHYVNKISIGVGISR
jgi:phospholipase A1